MPSPFPLLSRAAFPVLLLAASLTLAGCGEKKAEQSATTQLKDLEITDGTVNDAMTDLDGVKSEGTALADTGSTNTATNAIAPAATASADASTDASTDRGVDAKAEVVAEQ